MLIICVSANVQFDLIKRAQTVASVLDSTHEILIMMIELDPLLIRLAD